MTGREILCNEIVTMKLHTPFIIATTAIGLSSLVMAGEETTSIVPCKGSADSFRPWNIEASYLYMEADGESGYSNYDGQDHNSGYRLGISYQPTPESIGGRFTYTNFEGTQLSGVDNEDGPKLNVFDLEAFKTTQLGGVDLSYSLGVRFIDLYEPYGGGADVNYDGFGPVAGIEATYGLSCNFSLYANARVAFIFGEDDVNEVGGDAIMYQAGAGVQYDLCGLGLSGAYTRLGFEHQAYPELAYDDSDGNVAGVVFSLGYSF